MPDPSLVIRGSTSRLSVHTIGQRSAPVSLHPVTAYKGQTVTLFLGFFAHAAAEEPVDLGFTDFGTPDRSGLDRER